MYSFTTLALAALVVPAVAHMEMSNPPPFRSKYGATQPIEYNMVAPLSDAGADFPCKGFHHDAVEPVVQYAPGGSYSVEIKGGATHNGGSCQLSLSYDQGATWEVIKSFEGSCPASDGAQLGFTMPSDVQTGRALFAWTWFNHTGNREMYMNCAPVEITGGAARRGLNVTRRAHRPAMFVANVGNGCTTPAGTDVLFPHPGEVVEKAGTGNWAAPIGSCAAGGAAPPAEDPAAQSPPAEDAPTQTTPIGQSVETTPPAAAAAQPTAAAPPAEQSQPPTTVPTKVHNQQCRRRDRRHSRM
jgi:hypothetical protein